MSQRRKLTLQEQEERDTAAQQWVRRNFGERYESAHLSQLTGLDENIKKASKWLEKPRDFLVYIGNPGIAKTYFLAACARWFYCNWPSGEATAASGSKKLLPPDMRKFTEKEFFAKLKTKFGQVDDISGFGKDLAKAQVFILDELGKGMGTDWQCEQLFELIDERYNKRYPTLVASNFTRKQIEQHYGERYGDFMCSRLFAKHNTILEDFTSRDLRASGL